MEFVNESIRWSLEYLSAHGYKLNNSEPEEVQNTPWSYVARFDTNAGYVYLKHTPAKLGLEAHIIKILHEQFHAPVAAIIANHDNLNCFLMRDAGIPLRGLLKQEFNVRLACMAIDSLTSLQITVADHVNIFLDIGVPDWRLDKFPKLYQDLISRKDTLLEDGLSAIELNKLEALTPTVSMLAEKLSGYAIKESIVQPDFNDNNTLISDRTGQVTVIDLGEISISHPFFSLLNWLEQMKKHHGLSESDELFMRIKDACFYNFTKDESKNHLLEAFSIASKLWFVYDSFADYRLISACDIAMFTPPFKLQGRPALSLKSFLAAV